MTVWGRFPADVATSITYMTCIFGYKVNLVSIVLEDSAVGDNASKLFSQYEMQDYT